MKLAVVNTLWKRRWLSRLTLRRLRRAADASKYDVDLVAAVSEAPDEELCKREGWRHVLVPNLPLGRKHNAAMAACKGADAVVVVGSDNWLCDRFFDVMGERLESGGVDLLGVLDVYAVCSYSARAIHWGGYTGRRREGDSIGVGRVLTARTLEMTHWRPWDAKVSSGLDASMQRRYRSVRLRRDHRTCADWGVRVLGIKTNVNITSFEALARQRTSRELPRAEVLRAFPADEVSELLSSFEGAARHVEAERADERAKARLPDGTCSHMAGRAICGYCLGRVPGCTHMSGEGICRSCLSGG